MPKCPSGKLFNLIPDSMVALKPLMTHCATMRTILRQLHVAIPEWFVPEVAALQAKGGMFQLPYLQRWGFVLGGVVRAASKKLVLHFSGSLAGHGGSQLVSAATAAASTTTGAVTVVSLLLGLCIIKGCKMPGQ